MYLYQASPDNILNKREDELRPTALFNHPEDCENGKWRTNSNIRTAVLDGLGESFISLRNRHFYIWDVTRTDAPLLRQQGSNAPLTSVCWNPHDPDIVALGTVDRTIKVVDTRILQENAAGSVAWTSKMAHETAVKCIAWNPLVPHWLATGGEDGIIKIWDHRQTRGALLSLQDHEGAVTGLSWSRAHCEQLVSSGVDCSTRVWNLRMAPYFCVSCEERPHMGNSVVGCAVSPTKPFTFYSATSKGQTTTHTMKKSLLHNMVNHSTSKEAPTEVANSQRELNTEADIEQLLYTRDENEAFALIARLAKRYWAEERYDWVASLLKMTSPGVFAKLMKRGPATSFEQLLGMLSSCVISHSNHLVAAKASQSAEEAIKGLKLRVALVKLTETGKYKEILRLQDQICSSIVKQTNRVTAHSVAGLVGAVIPSGMWIWI